MSSSRVGPSNAQTVVIEADIVEPVLVGEWPVASRAGTFDQHTEPAREFKVFCAHDPGSLIGEPGEIHWNPQAGRDPAGQLMGILHDTRKPVIAAINRPGEGAGRRRQGAHIG